MMRSLRAAAVLFCSLLPGVSSASPARDATVVPADAEGALVGITWQLVEIVSMDGRVDAPGDRSRYTLQFDADGVVRFVADCHRATGSWTSASPGQLAFGQIAADQAACHPGSLHDRFMAQFPWVRSYVFRDGHLFLATMADGSIIEFEPIALTLAATVLGEEIRTDDPGEMQQILLTRLFDRYAKEQGIEVTEAEIDAFVDSMQRGMRAMGLTAEDELTPEEAAQVAQMRRDMGRSMVRQWKLNRSLYGQYGGRIIFQQLGPEPLDAYREYLEERQAAGDFTIHEKAFEDAFWRYVTKDSMHDFYEQGSEEEAQAFSNPPWERTPEAQ
jgi:heat shock protein HslJ